MSQRIPQSMLQAISQGGAGSRSTNGGSNGATNGGSTIAPSDYTMGGASERPASPFLDAESFERSSVDEGESPNPLSPFVQGFTLEGIDDTIAPRGGARRVLMAELHDDELEGAIYELAGEGARAIRHMDDPRSAAATLHLTYAPLLREADAALQRARDRLGDRELSSIDEAELEDALGDRGGVSLTPAMENFLGGIGRAVRRIASGAANLAKQGLAAAAKLGLGPIIDKLRALLPKVIGRIVKAVIHRIPAALQPDARRLAQALHIPIANELSDGESPDVAFDVAGIQQEFNEQVADVVLGEAEEEPENEYYIARDDASITGVGVHDLDRARERFVSELDALHEGEDVGPAVERFVPALLPALTLAKKIIGRKRVVSLLTPMIAKLIARFVGPQSSNALSAALVDSGLKLVGFEVTPEGERTSAHDAIAATVEETVRRVAALPEQVLDDSELVEGAILHEFEQAATANFPPLLPRPVYRQRPDLLEANRTRGVWVQCRNSRRGKRYKKYSRVFRARITPRMAMVIPTFGGAPLAAFLHEQLGTEPGEELEADVHLYEAMPGMLLSEVGDEQGEGGGLGEYDVHPLTSEAAALLLGEPGLGQELAPTSRPARSMAVGQRFYRLAIAGHRAPLADGARVAGLVPRRRRRRTHLFVTLDMPNRSSVVSLYLGERRAQELATSLRARTNPGAVVARLRPVIERLLRAALSGETTGRVRILHPSVEPTGARGPALRRLPAAYLHLFTTRLLDSALGGVATFLKGQSAQFIAATEDVKDGVTLRITIANPTGLPSLTAALGGAGGGAAPSTPMAGPPAAPNAGPPTVTVAVTAGHRHG